MNQKYIFLSILLIASFIVSGCGPSSEVRWYKIDGVEWANDRAQLKLSLPQPEKGDPTNEELTKLALDKNPSFFSEATLNEITYLRDIPGGEEFRASLFSLGPEYKNFGINLVAFEVIGSLPTP